ncbi:MAG: response regulator [Alphaproteobacteria bacterium]|nr:response regulator [Alphaproteobacteria bacterium]
MQSYNLDNVKILVVEDNWHWRRIIRTMLASLGARDLIIAEDGKEALELLADHSVDLVICDWMMPNLSGIELVRRLRTGEDSPNVYIPIMMLTAHTEKSRVEEARDAGVTEVLTKPLSIKDLYSHIAAIIENPRQFVRNETYFGPDRRRKRDIYYRGPERRVAQTPPPDRTQPKAAGGDADEARAGDVEDKAAQSQ